MSAVGGGLGRGGFVTAAGDGLGLVGLPVPAIRGGPDDSLLERQRRDLQDKRDVHDVLSIILCLLSGKK